MNVESRRDSRFRRQKRMGQYYVGQLLLLRYTRHTAIADPCAGA